MWNPQKGSFPVIFGRVLPGKIPQIPTPFREIGTASWARRELYVKKKSQRPTRDRSKNYVSQRRAGHRPLLARARRLVFTATSPEIMSRSRPKPKEGPVVKYKADNIPGISAGMAGLQDRWPRVFVERQDGAYVGSSHSHLHGQIE